MTGFVLAVAIGVAGSLGAVARFAVDDWVRHRTASTFPRGTLLVNVSGSLLMGALVGAVAVDHLPTGPLTIATVGFCGGYTTFSTATFETLQLARRGGLSAAIGYAAATLLLCLAAAAAGFAVTSGW